MLKKILLSLIMVVSLSFALTSVAKAASVRGYYKSNGTYVAPYTRSAPNALKYDNKSYNGGSMYNKSYSAPTKNYNSSWHTPKYYWMK